MNTAVSTPRPAPRPSPRPNSGKPRRTIAAFVFTAVALTACATASNTPAQAQLGGAAGKTINVSMAKLKFNPKKIEIKKGDSLNFVWKENVAHNIVFTSGGPKSKTQNKGAWLAKLSKVGIYKFKCTLHPGMEGVVAVR